MFIQSNYELIILEIGFYLQVVTGNAERNKVTISVIKPIFMLPMTTCVPETFLTVNKVVFNDSFNNYFKACLNGPRNTNVQFTKVGPTCI